MLVFVGYHTILARYVAKWGIAQMCLCETSAGGGVSHHFGGVLTSMKKYWKAFQPEFGAYRGSARVLNSPSNPQNCRKKEKILEKGTFKTCAKLWYAPNPGSKEI